MGRFADKVKEKEKNRTFTPLELDEMNVQALFNRCLAKPDSKEIASSVLFSRLLGFSGKDEKIIRFDKTKLTDNKPNIEYLYGQLNVVHKNLSTPKFPIADFISLYNEEFWTKDTDTLFKFLYLGVVPELGLINPVLAKDKTTVLRRNILPTLSPKDPNFPAWWEEHIKFLHIILIAKDSR